MSVIDQPVYTIMPIYNRYHETRRAIASLLGSSYTNNTICLIDNGSTDGSLDMLLQEYPQLHHVRLPENRGFSAAVNIGIREAYKNQARFVFLCNNDVVVCPEMLGHLVAQTNNTVGAVSPVIYYMDHPFQIWFAGYRRDTLLLELRPHDFAQNDEQFSLKPFRTDYIFGCGMLINMAAIEATGGFDERYFFYYEDMDFSLRLAQAKFSLWVVPCAKMWHEVSLTAGRDSPFSMFHKARSSVIFFNTHVMSPTYAADKSDYSWSMITQLKNSVVRQFRTVSVLCFRLASTIKKSLILLIQLRMGLLTSHWRGLVAGWRSRGLSPQTNCTYSVETHP
jgi:GT2 family glycosyltransferase